MLVCDRSSIPLSNNLSVIVSEMQWRDEDGLASQTTRSEALPKVAPRHLFHSSRGIARVSEGQPNTTDFPLRPATLSHLVGIAAADEAQASVAAAPVAANTSATLHAERGLSSQQRSPVRAIKPTLFVSHSLLHFFS